LAFDFFITPDFSHISQTLKETLEPFALCAMRSAIVHANTITIVSGFKAKVMQKFPNDVLHFFELPSHFSGR
jgi:hypothetical protein